MDKKSFTTPDLIVLEFNLEGAFCASVCNGNIDQLNETYDWSDMWGDED